MTRARNRFQRLRAEREHVRAAAVPDVVRNPADAVQQMRFFDQLGPETRAAIRASRFDFDAVNTWRDGYRMERADRDLASDLRREDGRRSGAFGPKSEAGI